MTTPLRRSLLNTEISFQARCIAHEATMSCRGADMPNLDDHHTPNCNELKRKIETLCLQIKCAAVQPPQQREPDYPADHPVLGDLGSVPL